MNPSTSGWIKKYNSIIKEQDLFYNDFSDLYYKSRSNGFVYGLSNNVPKQIIHEHKYSQDEIVKVNLLNALYHIYVFNKGNRDYKGFVSNAVAYYKTLGISDLSFWDKLFIGKDEYSILERLLHDRIQIDNNLFTRNFNKTMTNALVFIDVLAFNHYLQFDGKNDLSNYFASLETILVNITYDALNFKDDKKKADKEILRTIKESVSYVRADRKDFNLFYRTELESNFSFFEKKYFMDIACLAIWEDYFVDDKEYNFVKSIGTDMNLSTDEIDDSLKHIADFYKLHKDDFLLFKSSNPIYNFYENSSQLVLKLISRNSKRIFKELSQSKELMVLLTQATTRELTKEEQTKVQLQLIDIFKTIPSLAIFILPGGAILLPIVVKLIPNMLPSTFDDNKVEEEKKD